MAVKDRDTYLDDMIEAFLESSDDFLEFDVEEEDADEFPGLTQNEDGVYGFDKDGAKLILEYLRITGVGSQSTLLQFLEGDS